MFDIFFPSHRAAAALEKELLNRKPKPYDYPTRSFVTQVRRGGGGMNPHWTRKSGISGGPFILLGNTLIHIIHGYKLTSADEIWPNTISAGISSVPVGGLPTVVLPAKLVLKNVAYYADKLIERRREEWAKRDANRRNGKVEDWMKDDQDYDLIYFETNPVARASQKKVARRVLAKRNLPNSQR